MKLCGTRRTNSVNEFKNIPHKYRPIPFWSWNEKLNILETQRQIELMQEAGLGGYFMHARGGLQTKYLGQEWQDNISTGIEYGKKYHMGAWIYDENGWPSGFGNGIVNGKGVKYQQKFLRCEKGEKQQENTIANIDGYHFYYDVNPYYVDLLDREVVKTFIDEIYVPYYETYGADIEGFFTDEPQISRDGIPWSFTLEEAYKREYGEELKNILPQLFWDKADYINSRVKFWKLITKLFTENFTKQVYEWCDERGLKLTGHMSCEETLAEQITANGAVMPHYEYFHIPGMDCLGRVEISKMVMLQVASVAQQLGKEQILSETFALTGWNVCFEELKHIYEWQMVRGINLLCTHLAAYSLRGIRKRDFPAAFSYQQPWWNEYHKFVDFASRVGMLLSKGKMECDTLLIHPQTTAWALYSEESKEKIEDYNTAFINTIDELERKHILFHLGDEMLMEKYAKVEGSFLVVGNQKYSRVVLPEHLVFLESTKALLEEFRKNGGIITDCSEMDFCDIVDNPEITYTKRIFDDMCLYYFVNSTKDEQIVNIKRGNYILNSATGELEAFQNQNRMPASSSLIVLDYGKENVVDDKEETPKHTVSLDGMWKVKKADLNELTLDYCKYSFDGEVIEDYGPVISIQDKACGLGRKVKIDMEYQVCAEYVPNELYLVCETPEIFAITVNGKKLKKDVCGYCFDQSFKKIDLASYFKTGVNIIRVSCDFEQSESTYENLKNALMFEGEKNKLTYDMEIESLYLVGNFSLKTEGSFEKLDRSAVRYSGDFIIAKPAEELQINNIEQQGYPFFAGEITLEKKFVADRQSEWLFAFAEKNANVVSVKVNGSVLDSIIWKPYSVELTPFIKEGENSIEVTLVNSLRNLLGPHHLQQGESYQVTPASFYKECTVWGDWGKGVWNDGYCFVKFGIKP